MADTRRDVSSSPGRGNHIAPAPGWASVWTEFALTLAED